MGWGEAWAVQRKDHTWFPHQAPRLDKLLLCLLITGPCGVVLAAGWASADQQRRVTECICCTALRGNMWVTGLICLFPKFFLCVFKRARFCNKFLHSPNCWSLQLCLCSCVVPRCTVVERSWELLLLTLCLCWHVGNFWVPADLVGLSSCTLRAHCWSPRGCSRTAPVTFVAVHSAWFPAVTRSCLLQCCLCWYADLRWKACYRW